MLKLYRFRWDCRRNGSVEGIFVAKEEDVDALIGKHVYFGEILGKHSEVQGEIEADDIEVLTDDQAFIKRLVEILFHEGTEVCFDTINKAGWHTISGYNPVAYYDPEEDGR